MWCRSRRYPPAKPTSSSEWTATPEISAARISSSSRILCRLREASKNASCPPPWLILRTAPGRNPPRQTPRISSIFSPTPMNLTGMPSSCLIAMTMPPLAVPSSLFSDAGNIRRLAEFLCLRNGIRPVVASSTSKVPGWHRQFAVDDAVDLGKLVHRFFLFCRRPAVSMISTSAARFQRPQWHQTRRRRGHCPRSASPFPHRALAPDSQLVNRRRAEGVRRRHDHAFALQLQGA